MVCKDCGKEKVDFGIPGYPQYACMEGCEDLTKIMPILTEVPMEKRVVFDKDKLEKLLVEFTSDEKPIYDFVDAACKSYACSMLEKVKLKYPGGMNNGDIRWMNYQTIHADIDAIIATIKSGTGKFCDEDCSCDYCRGKI